MPKDKPRNPLIELDPREKLNAGDLITHLKTALTRGAECDYYRRLQLNLETRYCIWPDQSDDGRKWLKANRRLKPGESTEVFPWAGASDARVRKVDEIILERVGFQQAAYDRADMRVTPRDLMTDEDLVQQASVWTMVANYYNEANEREQRRAVRRWIDLAETYGHSVLFVDWQTNWQIEPRQIEQEKLMVLVAETAVMLANEQRRQQLEQAGQTELPEMLLTPEEVALLQETATRELQGMIEDPDRLKQLVDNLMAYDPAMTEGEARRVAKGLRQDQQAEYYVAVAKESGPRLKELMPFVDVFYPPEVTCLKESPWIAWGEWLSDVDLKARIVTDGYNEKVVTTILEAGGGTALNLTEVEGLRDYGWVMTGTRVGRGLSKTIKDEASRLYQVMHVYYRALSKQGVPALYHTVIHGSSADAELMHEVLPHYHGQYPFFERAARLDCDTLIDAQGVGEISFTYQQEIKAQRDMRVDNAAVQMQPPAFVPMNHAGGRMSFSPRAQIPVRMGGSQGKPEFVRIPADAKTSQEVENATKQSLDELWFRGITVEESVKLTMRQMLVNDFLSDFKAVSKLQFQLIQQYGEEKVKAGMVRGVPVNMEVSREEIQGNVSLQMHFDVADLDYSLVEKKATLFKDVVVPLDRTGNLPTDEILKVVLGGIAPGWARVLVQPTDQVAQKEADEEQRILGEMLNGIEPQYIPGKDHRLRLEVLMQALGRVGPDGLPGRVQRILAENPDVQALVENRIKFHQFQIKQTVENPEIGRLGVEPVQP